MSQPYEKKANEQNQEVAAGHAEKQQEPAKIYPDCYSQGIFSGQLLTESSPDKPL
jgi:hypothetical protein